MLIDKHANRQHSSGPMKNKAAGSMQQTALSGRDLAAAVQRRLLDHTPLDDFGLIGNFNYAPIRLVTWMPAALWEQGFLTHPGDEARLLDPAFRALTAKAVRLGLEDFLRLQP